MARYARPSSLAIIVPAIAFAKGCAPAIAYAPDNALPCLTIVPTFGADAPQGWPERVQRNAAEASAIICQPTFLERVRKWPVFSWTRDTPEQVAKRLAHAGRVEIPITFFDDATTRAIAAETGNGVSINIAKGSAAGGLNNISHEAMHVVGYRHCWNWTFGQANTVPWRIGEWVEETASRP